MADKKTSKKVASQASKILSDPKSTKAEKSVAASDLAQAKSSKKTSPAAAKEAAKLLASPRTSPAKKAVAGSDLVQKEKPKPPKKKS